MTQLMAEPVTAKVTVELGNTIFFPGTYEPEFGFNFSVTDIVTLDAKNNPAAIFIFRPPINSSGTGALTFSNFSSVILKNGARGCQIYWLNDHIIVGQNSILQGMLLALSADISLAR